MKTEREVIKAIETLQDEREGLEKDNPKYYALTEKISALIWVSNDHASTCWLET